MKTNLLFLSLLGFTLIFSSCGNKSNDEEGESSIDLNAELELNPLVRTGELENGMKYYLMYNLKPENRAEFRLAINAGSILEAEDQLGLAHFVEHMCFNGSANFEKNELVDYLESIGVNFGAHLNAYTSFDETVYMLKLPTDSAEILDNGLQVLEDWAHLVSFEPEMIDDERGVVIEEWRSSLGPDMRMTYEYLPVVLEGSQYAERLPIGDPILLDTFHYESLTRFYNDWYRPDLMGLIVVGDFDMDEMEQRIIDQFSGMPATEGPERVDYGIPDYEGTKVAIITDPEASSTDIELLYKHPAKEMITIGDFRDELVADMYASMLYQRFEEIKLQEDPPFASAYGGYSEFLGGQDAYSVSLTVSEEKVNAGLMTALIENERILRHGFNQSELDRVKEEMLSDYEKSYNERDKINSGTLVWPLVSHFLEGSAAPGVERSYELANALIPDITLDDVNALAGEWISEDNAAVIITGPSDAESMFPNEEDVLAMISEVKTLDIDPYEDSFVGGDLLTEIPEPGVITSTSTIDELGITVWEYSNGATVVLKPTDFKNDEILFSSYSMGGSSLYADDEYWSATWASDIIYESGLGEMSPTDMQKWIAGKQVQVAPFIDDYTEGISGSSTPDDFETALQMIYMYHTAPRKDETAFSSLMSQVNIMMGSLASNPDFYFYLEAAKITSDGSIRGQLLPDEDQMGAIDLDMAMEAYNERFGDADFTYLFVGSFDPNEIEPMVSMYIGGLPEAKEEDFGPYTYGPPNGNAQFQLNKGTEPKSQVMLVYHGDMTYDFSNRYALYSTMDILDIMLRESMREDMGGVYGVQVYPDVQMFPSGKYMCNIMWSCSPDNVDELIATAEAEIAKLKSEGPSSDNILKIQETQRRQRETDLEENSWWLSALSQYYMAGEDPLQILDYGSYVDGVTPEMVQQTANSFFNSGQRIQIVMYPEGT